MDLNKLKDPFKEDELEWRIGQAGRTSQGKIWAKPLVYVSARAAQDRFDEVCGIGNWKVEYEAFSHDGLAKGILARISIKLDNSEWVSKVDGADQTETEAFKGGLSSAFKRAASVWGCSRYLYDIEPSYAEIVDKGVPNSKYGQAKIKGQNGQEEKVTFYWKPPRLPAWALPK